MDEEEIKESIDFDRIGEFTDVIVKDVIETKTDYLMDDKGNYIIPLSPLEFKLIEKIKELEARIIELERR